MPQLEECCPNLLVRYAFYLSVFAIPFGHLYVPGTGERLGVTRIVQFLIFGAVVSQPRVCLRLIPVALFWFVAYCAVRISLGLWLAPELGGQWWPSTFQWLQFSLPWLWVMFNLLQYPKTSRGGLWALVWGCSLCSLFHIAGIGTVEVPGEEGRSSVFGENANVIAAAYGSALVALVGLGMLRDLKLGHRILIIPLVLVLGTGLAKTGSRAGVLIFGIGILVLLCQARSVVSRAQRYGLLLVIGAMLAAVVCQMPTVLKRFELVKSSSRSVEEPRARMAPVLWEIFLRSPIYGSGPDQYQFELTRRAMPYLIQEQRTISAHNLALLLLVETGVIGFFLFSMGVKSALVAAWRSRSKSWGLLPLALILPMAIAGVTVSNPGSTPLFWLTMAYGLAGANEMTDEQ